LIGKTKAHKGFWSVSLSPTSLHGNYRRGKSVFRLWPHEKLMSVYSLACLLFPLWTSAGCSRKKRRTESERASRSLNQLDEKVMNVQQFIALLCFPLVFVNHLNEKTSRGVGSVGEELFGGLSLQ
jgi:hypothetical protein